MVYTIPLLLGEIMRYAQCKNNRKTIPISVCIFTLLLLTLGLAAQTKQKPKIKNSLTNQKQPLLKSDSTLRADSNKVKIDSFSLRNYSKDSIAAPINYSAEDSGVLDIPSKMFVLYGKATTKYQSMDLTSSTIVIDNQNHRIKAYGMKDSLGRKMDVPVMNDGSMKTTSDSMFYDTKSQKGLTKTTFTQSGEMYIYAERIKKTSPNTFFAYNGRFTTCNLDTPHFAFRTRKMKIINNKWGYSGLTYPEFEGVPIPVGIPFGIFPLNRGRHSGMLAPSFANTQSYGLGLENLGYYKVINEYLDITVRGNVYSYGGYTLNLTPTYRKRYAYNGGLTLGYIHTKLNFKGDPDFSTTNAFNITWNHSVDSKAHPGQTFSANVNMGSTKYNSLITNNTYANFTSTLTSSIQYSKSWDNGKYSLQASATGSQNNNLHNININLPNLNFNAATFYPFEKKERIGTAKWYEKLGIGYSGQLQNQVNWYDTAVYAKGLSKHLLDTLQWGAVHNIPITLSLPSLGVFQVSPGFSYQENWHGQKNLRQWNNATQHLDTLISRGFFQERQISTSLSLQTAIFGTYHFKGNNLVAIRHTIRPSISMNFAPDLVKQYHYRMKVNALGDSSNFSSFEGGVIGGFGGGTSGGLSFSITQQIEGKVKDKSDSTGKATKKIHIIDNISINSAYNFLATGDSCKLAPISIQLGTTLFQKINISANTTVIPYVLNKFGQQTAQYAWKDTAGFSLGHITSGSLSMSANFQSKKKEDKKGAPTKTENDYYNPEEEQSQLNYVRNHPAEYTDFNIPWNIGMSLSVQYTKSPKPDFSGFTSLLSSSLSLNGDFSLTPKWKVGGNGYYDFRTMKLQTVTMFISREMHCWQLSINVTPVGPYQSFNFSINPKSGILRDLKINRTRSFVTPYN